MFLHAILSVSYAFPTGLTFPRKRSLPKAFYNTVLKNFYVSSLTALNTIDQLIPYFWWPSPSLTLFNSIFTLFFYFTTCFYPPHYPLIAPSLFGFFNPLLQRRNEREKKTAVFSFYLYMMVFLHTTSRYHKKFSTWSIRIKFVTFHNWIYINNFE